MKSRCFQVIKVESRKSSWRWTTLSLCAALNLYGPISKAAQLGPLLPTHHFPTDKSFHLGYRLSIVNSSNNFVEPRVTEPLKDDSAIRITRHEFTPEFQPNRKLSLGARLVFDQMKLGSQTSTQDISKSALGDQSVFAEFRFFDEVGHSLGFATVFKFPGYSNPTLKELNNSPDPSRTLLLGDAQIDTSFYLTGEKWLGSSLRTRANLGYTLRLDGYAPEIPYMFSIGVVNPKMDFELRFKGNKSAGDGTANDSNTQQIRSAFANSEYAYSPNPWLFVIEPAVELWISAKAAITAHYAYSLMGNRAPSYHAFGVGLMYRWAETISRTRRTYKEVPIFTDLEAGKFEGEGGSTPESESLEIDVDPVFED